MQRSSHALTAALAAVGVVCGWLGPSAPPHLDVVETVVSGRTVYAR